MEKVYDLTKETEYFRSLCYNYMIFEKINTKSLFSHNQDPLNCHELLRFAVHQAECGENVYIINFPRQVQVLHRPNTLFFLERWADFLDVSDLDHILILAISNRNGYDHYRIQETYSHIQSNFESVISISFQN